MFRNHVKIALRSLSRHKLYTSLNIAGLAFGLTCFLLIGLYLFDELTFDQQHSKQARIYRAIQYTKTPADEVTVAASSYNVSEQSPRHISDIENTARLVRLGRANMTNPANNNAFQETVTLGNKGLLEVFDFETLDGDGKSALNEPNSVVMTEAFAQRLFQTSDVVGKTVSLDFIPDKALTITAVLKNHPRNSSFDFNYLLSEETLNHLPRFQQQTSDWLSQSYQTFFLLKEQADPAIAAQKINALLAANAKPEPGTQVRYSLQPLADMHLYSQHITDGARNGNVQSMVRGTLLYIRIFAIVALFVLLIACINYMNLATARAANRSKEIGVRKANGAFRSHLIGQFLTESLVVTAVAFLLAILAVNLVLPAFNEFTGKDLSLGFRTDYRIWLLAVTALVITSLLSGSYPAFLLSRFSPLLLLKSVRFSNKSDLSLRKSLVVFQFTISVVMMVSTIVLYRQVRFANNKDLGFKKDLLLVVDINSGKVRNGAATIQAEFGKLPSVEQVSVTSRVPGEWKNIPLVKIKQEGSTREPQIAYILGVDEQFNQTFAVRLLKGRNFAGLADSSSVILNETAAKALHIKEPSEQLIDIPAMAFGGSFMPVYETNQSFKVRVIGIVNDFHFQSIREKIAPMVLAYQRNPVTTIDYFTARVDGHDIPATLAAMNKIMTGIDPAHLLEYHFLDDQLALFYQEDQRRETMLIWVSLATIFIACLGLFGLATYAAEQRIKEIGVRKVLGASTFSLTALLSGDFLKLVLIANAIAFPVAWWATNKWLEEFAYHIEVEWWMFLVSGLAAIFIALLTVSYQAIKAAMVNPVKSLRSE
ncbi:hypothetical protein BLX24_28290 [Arsenicibacter rosenii]|uniref:Cell division protein FtsX n=2 Tax=Arsenicibacter rosenii TaxID=1750698 RepID=A0A1S2VAT0_9BACT|nr:hypothetical protein BLX24_28290 [Arsenicibacter rosenii]